MRDSTVYTRLFHGFQPARQAFEIGTGHVTWALRASAVGSDLQRISLRFLLSLAVSSNPIADDHFEFRGGRTPGITPLCATNFLISPSKMAAAIDK
jgi:hypothetical protein